MEIARSISGYSFQFVPNTFATLQTRFKSTYPRFATLNMQPALTNHKIWIGSIIDMQGVSPGISIVLDLVAYLNGGEVYRENIQSCNTPAGGRFGVVGDWGQGTAVVDYDIPSGEDICELMTAPELLSWIPTGANQLAKNIAPIFRSFAADKICLEFVSKTGPMNGGYAYFLKFVSSL